MGDLKGLTASLNIIVADHAPESDSPQLGSAIRAAYNSGGSATTGSRFDDTPIPIDLTKSPTGRKRRATETSRPEPNSDDELLAMFDKPLGPAREEIKITARPWPATPIIVQDCITTGNSVKAIFSLVVADETMVFVDETAAQTFCALLLSLRKKFTPSLSLSAAARMAGIDKSFIMSIDMPLCIPNAESTAMASYVSSIANIGFFANEADTRQLAKDTVSAMRGLGWQPTAGLAIRYQRAVTLAESFVPAQVVPDKLTYLGQPWKPLNVVNGKEWAQIILADEARTLRWEGYDAIGQAHQVSEG